MKNTFELYDQYRAQNEERAKKLDSFQEVRDTAQREAVTLKQQYEYFFSESVKNGTDDSARLTKLDEQIEEAQKKSDKASRDYKLAHAAMPGVKIDPVDVVREFRDVYAPGVRKEIIPPIEAKLKLARDLVISAIMDGKSADGEYSEITQAIKDISQTNHTSGKTSAWEHVGHPTTDASVFGVNGGALAGARKVLEDVSKYTFGNVPHDFVYVEKVPTIKGGK